MRSTVAGAQFIARSRWIDGYRCAQPILPGLEAAKKIVGWVERSDTHRPIIGLSPQACIAHKKTAADSGLFAGRVCACVVGALAPYNHGLPFAGETWQSLITHPCRRCRALCHLGQPLLRGLDPQSRGCPSLQSSCCQNWWRRHPS